MNESNSKNRSIIAWLPVAVIVLLTVISGYLYTQKIRFQAQNRELIIKNDSLSGANIELLRSIQSRVYPLNDSLVTWEQPAP